MALAAATPVHADEPAITPRPLQVVEQPGPPIRFADGTPVLATGPRAIAAAHYLIAMARRSGGPRLTFARDRRRHISIRFIRQPGFGPEAYALDVAANGARITASDRAGLLYGAVSLWQLLSAASDSRLAPVHIADAPRFPWRGLVLDSARHFPSPAAIDRMLDWMAWHKLNRLQWHLADDQGWRLQIKRYPRLTSVGAWRTTPPAAGLVPGRYGGFYTQDQVRRILALAAARNITIVPEIEMPGHATAAILAYPRFGLTTATAANLGDWGVFPSIYGVDAASFSFLYHILDEVMALFPSREIAIGGDEAVHTLWEGSPAVQARMQALGLKDGATLQAWFVSRIGAYLHAHGRRLVGWDEILADGALDKAAIVLSWHGADGAIAAARAGHDVVMATAPSLYFDNRQSTSPAEPPGRGTVVALADIYGYDPGNPPHSLLTAPLDPVSATHVLGVQGALWSEHIADDTQLEAMALPRAAALAEIGWTASARRDWHSFVTRIPAMMARYAALGLHADDGATAVQARLALAGDHASVALDRQLALGDIRYTENGTAPTPASPRYDGPLALPLTPPVAGRLRAASFSGAQRLSRDLDLTVDARSLTRRTSQQLELCTGKVALNLASSAGTGERYLVDIKNPCWLYRAAALSGIRHVAVSIAALPFNFQLANEPGQPVLAPAVDASGDLVLRLGCSGAVLATLPLPDDRSAVPQELIAEIPPQVAPQDVCITVARAHRDPLWALGWVELRP